MCALMFQTSFDSLLGCDRRAATDESGCNSVEVKGWESQARDIVFDITQSDKYKSIALHAEVKLAEALERCARVCPATFAPGGEEKPNKLKSAVCCQVCLSS